MRQSGLAHDGTTNVWPEAVFDIASPPPGIPIMNLPNQSALEHFDEAS